MALNEWQAREADSYSKRRRSMDREQRGDFDAHYGKQTASGSMSRNNGGAGKGDSRRQGNSLLYDLGYTISFDKTLTDDERRQLTEMWTRIKNGEAPPQEITDAFGPDKTDTE
jgi:hypothetical protein